MFLMSNSDCTIGMLQLKSRLNESGDIVSVFYCPVLVNLCDLWPEFPVLHLLQSSICGAFGDRIPHTLVVTSGYLSCCPPSYHVKPA